jgi:ATP:corrinoid adenosyltransferase
MDNNDKDARHNRAMEKQKAAVDAGVAAATIDRGVAVLLTGDGKGKTSSAFGMVLRALGYGQKVGVIQFIKGRAAIWGRALPSRSMPRGRVLPNGHRLYLGYTRPQ